MKKDHPQISQRDADLKTGWWNPNPFISRGKFHYVGDDGRSLCGKWLYLKGDLDDSKDDHPDNCTACRKKKNLRSSAKSADKLSEDAK